MLLGWGIHHFHLGAVPNLEDPTYVKRNRHLFYARLTKDAAYVIGMSAHGAWSDAELVGFCTRIGLI